MTKWLVPILFVLVVALYALSLPSTGSASCERAKVGRIVALCQRGDTTFAIGSGGSEYPLYHAKIDSVYFWSGKWLGVVSWGELCKSVYTHYMLDTRTGEESRSSFTIPVNLDAC